MSPRPNLSDITSQNVNLKFISWWWNPLEIPCMWHQYLIQYILCRQKVQICQQCPNMWQHPSQSLVVTSLNHEKPWWYHLLKQTSSNVWKRCGWPFCKMQKYYYIQWIHEINGLNCCQNPPKFPRFLNVLFVKIHSCYSQCQILPKAPSFFILL